jgi:hypothetical protein
MTVQGGGGGPLSVVWDIVTVTEAPPIEQTCYGVKDFEKQNGLVANQAMLPGSVGVVLHRHGILRPSPNEATSRTLNGSTSFRLVAA